MNTLIKHNQDTLQTTTRHHQISTISIHLQNTFLTLSRQLPDTLQTPFRHLPDTFQTPSKSPDHASSLFGLSYTHSLIFICFRWVGGWWAVPLENQATSWLHLASWNLLDSQVSLAENPRWSQVWQYHLFKGLTESYP